jgi:tellurite resistance protein TerC
VLGSAASYATLAAVVLGAVVVDLHRVSRQDDGHRTSVRRAARDYAGWSLLGFAAAGPIAALGDGSDAVAYTTAYVLEKSLSLDNVAVFTAIFVGFAVQESKRPALLGQGIIGALVLRVVFILVGVALLDAVHSVLIVFGALLILTGLRMLHGGGGDHEPRPPRLPRALLARPGLAPLLTIIVADVVFAVDSIPAAFGVTTNSFLVVASNAFAILGLRPTYVLLAGGMARFAYLEPAVAVLLVAIGVKLAVADLVHVPDLVSLAAVALVLAGGIVLSLLVERRRAPAADAPQHKVSEPAP